MKGKVLLIEDNVQNRYLVTFLLEKHGFEVHSAVDGSDGEAMARAIEPDIILLDIQLPGADGYVVAQNLRRHPPLATVPIIAVTSFAMVGDKEKALESGCTGYLEKPINPETFVKDIEEFVKAGNLEP